MKRTSVVASVLAATMALSLAACGGSASTSESASASESTAASTSEAAESTEAEATGDFDADQDITVISREDGSGTRGAFIELTGVEEKNDAGEKVDMTTEAAAIQSSTNGVMTAVANDETAIGYISLGSLNDTVKAVTVGGVEANSENVSNGTYTLARPFNIVTNGEPTDAVAVDFIAYCMSPDAGPGHRGRLHRRRRHRVHLHPAQRQHHGGWFLLRFSPDGEAHRGLQDRQPQRHHRDADH